MHYAQGVVSRSSVSVVQTMSGILRGVLRAGNGTAAIGGPIIGTYGFPIMWIAMSISAACAGALWSVYVVVMRLPRHR